MNKRLSKEKEFKTTILQKNTERLRYLAICKEFELISHTDKLSGREKEDLIKYCTFWNDLPEKKVLRKIMHYWGDKFDDDFVENNISTEQLRKTIEENLNHFLEKNAN